MRIIVILIFMSALSRPLESSDNSALKDPMTRIAALLHSNDIQRIEIISLPERILTRTALTAEMLEKQWEYKLIIAQPSSNLTGKKVLTTFEASRLTSTEKKADLRWGCSFYNTAGDKIFTAYFDPAGKIGIVDGQAVTSNGKVVRLLKRLCSGFNEA